MFLLFCDGVLLCSPAGLEFIKQARLALNLLSWLWIGSITGADHQHQIRSYYERQQTAEPVSIQNKGETPLPTKIPTDSVQARVTRRLPVSEETGVGLGCRDRPRASPALTFGVRRRLRALPAGQEGLGQQQRNG